MHGMHDWLWVASVVLGVAGGSCSQCCPQGAAVGPPGLCVSMDPPDQLPAQHPLDSKNSPNLSDKPGPKGLQGTNLEVQKETRCVDVTTMAESTWQSPGFHRTGSG